MTHAVIVVMTTVNPPRKRAKNKRPSRGLPLRVASRGLSLIGWMLVVAVIGIVIAFFARDNGADTPASDDPARLEVETEPAGD